MTGSVSSLTPSPALGSGVKLADVRQVFDAHRNPVVALDGISLTINPGQFVALLGPSGCGKSSLLRLIAGLDKPTSGQVELLAPAPSGEIGWNDAQSRPTHNLSPHSHTAFVFQDAHLLPWRNVLRNVELPLELLGTDAMERRAAASAALQQVGLSDALTRFPAQLSGGMKMRVSLARAMVTQPRLLLLDEPFAALDEITRHRLDEQLRSLWLHRRFTVIFVTHSIHEATFLADRVIVLSSRPARMMLDHTLDLPPHRDSQLRTDPRFASQMRLLQNALERGFE